MIEHLHLTAEDERHECIGWQEGQACCLDRVRTSPEFAAAKAALEAS
jgi:hypothetical protein